MVLCPLYQVKDVDVMEISREAFEALKSYFNCLAHVGYKPYIEVEQLLVLLFIEEILTGPMSIMVTEDDYNDINNALYCLYGSCMIPYPAYLKSMAELNMRVIDRYRLTESGSLRTSSELFRTLS